MTDNPASTSPAAPAAPAAPPVPPAPAPEATAPSPAPSAPPAGQTPAAPGTAYRPEGLPDNFAGATDRETIDALAKAVKGYRDRDATRDVPTEAAAYLDFGDVPAEAKAHFDTLKGDPLFDKVAGVALQFGIPKGAFTSLVKTFVTEAATGGLLEPPVNLEAERAALVPEAARALPPAEQKAAIDRRISDNLAWVTQMQGRGLAKDAADHLVMMLGDSAKGHQAIEFFRAQMAGTAPAPITGGAQPTGDTADTLRAEAERAENTPGNPKFSQASYDALQSRYRALYR